MYNSLTLSQLSHAAILYALLHSKGICCAPGWIVCARMQHTFAQSSNIHKNALCLQPPIKNLFRFHLFTGNGLRWKWLQSRNRHTWNPMNYPSQTLVQESVLICSSHRKDRIFNSRAFSALKSHTSQFRSHLQLHEQCSRQSLVVSFLETINTSHDA